MKNGYSKIFTTILLDALTAKKQKIVHFVLLMLISLSRLILHSETFYMQDLVITTIKIKLADSATASG